MAYTRWIGNIIDYKFAKFQLPTTSGSPTILKKLSPKIPYKNQ
jgi:hypothetical protein